MKKITNITRERQNTLAVVLENRKIFFPVKYRTYLSHIFVTSNGCYRLADVVKGFDSARALATTSKYKGTLAEEYSTTCDKRGIMGDISLFKKLLKKYQQKYKGEKAKDDECVVMYRTGDRLGLGRFHEYRDKVVPVIVEMMKTRNLSNVTIVTSLFFGGSEASNTSLQQVLEHLMKLVDDLKANDFIENIQFRSSALADDDLMFGLSAKHVVVTAGVYPMLIKLFGNNIDVMDVGDYTKFYNTCLPFEHITTSLPAARLNRKFNKIIGITGEDYGECLEYLVKLALQKDPSYDVRGIKNGFIVIDETLLVVIDPVNTLELTGYGLLNLGKFVLHNVGSTEVSRRLDKILDIPVVNRQSVFMDIFKEHAFVFTKVPRAASTSLADIIRHNSCCNPDEYWPHIPLSAYRSNNQVLYDRKYSFAIVRHPVERFLSAYNHIRALVERGRPYYYEKDQVNAKVYAGTADDCVRMLYDDFYHIGLHASVFRPQSYYVCYNNKVIANELFPFEYLEQAWEIIKTKTGLVGELPHLKGETDKPTELSTESIVMLQEMYAHDYEIYNDAVDKFIMNYTEPVNRE